MSKVLNKYPNIINLHARCIYENDKFKGAYAVAHFKDGSYQFEIMAEQEIEKIRFAGLGTKASKSIWCNYEQMAQNIVLNKLCRHLLDRKTEM